MPPFDEELGAYECRTCGSTGCKETSCCDAQMESVDDSTEFESPDLQDVVGEVFGISSTELEICRLIMDKEKATVTDLYEEFDRDRSVITRHLNHLVEIGVVKKNSRVLEEGGRVNVYLPRSAEEIRRQFRLGLYAWLGEASDLVDDLTKEKLEAMFAPADEEISAELQARTPAERAEPQTDDDTEWVIKRLFSRDDSP